MFCQLGTSSSAAQLTTADEDGVIKLGLHDRDPALVHWLEDERMELSTPGDRVKPLLTFRVSLFVVVQVEQNSKCR